MGKIWDRLTHFKVLALEDPIVDTHFKVLALEDPIVDTLASVQNSLNFFNNSSFSHWFSYNASRGTVSFPPMIFSPFSFNHYTSKDTSLVYRFWQVPMPADITNKMSCQHLLMLIMTPRANKVFQTQFQSQEFSSQIQYI